MRFDNVLVTTDFSDDSLRALETAAYEAKMSGAKITLVTVVSDWEVPVYIAHEVPNPETIAAYRKQTLEAAEKKIQELISTHFHGQKVQGKVLMSSKPVAQEICDIASNEGCNLIIISSHGRGAIGNMLLGSVVQKVLKLAPCPVLVIPKKRS